ncbi:cytochrome P450 monooxygenase [Podospora didyma]|uniref:Cytochrome P450 monooxygenase n=1 Tax=Podospora didyma TaxID=330526 RepID=A0AAE0K1I2_9PEZI|nr:cytochrome P450 monooxygenase [Podospora didyma]
MAVFTDVKSTVVLLSFAVVVCIYGLVVYRLYFHPLSKFPGPFFRAVSELPAIFGLVSGRNHAIIKGLHDQYGSVVRLAPNELSFCGADAWEDIYGLRAFDEPMEKDPNWAGVTNASPDGALVLTQAPGAHHTRLRRAWAQPFSTTSCMQQEPIIQEQVEKFISILMGHAKAGQPVNMSQQFLSLMLDIISDLCFSAPFGCLDNASGIEWSRRLRTATYCMVGEMITKRLAGPGTFLQKLLYKYAVPSRYKEAKLGHFMESKEKILKRIDDGEKIERKDFIYFVLRQNEVRNVLSPSELFVNTSLFIAAGSDTTALNLAVTTYFLLTSPDAYKALVSEVRNNPNIHSAADLKWSNLKNLPYLGAVINESLRLRAVIVSGLLRAVPRNGATIDGRFVPAGTTVSVHMWSACHSTCNFTRPQEFLPERWVYPEQFPNDKKHAAQPFSYGPRGCIGKMLSLIEQKIILAHIIWHFDLELEGSSEAAWKWACDGDEFRYIKTYINWEKPDELMVRLIPVQRD